jgi:uncharacterized membrane protein YkoI
MKKSLTVAMLVFALLLTMTGCSAARAVQKIDAAEERFEERLDRAEDRLEDSVRKQVKPDVKNTPSAVAEGARVLSQEQALQAALDYLGFAKDQVTRIRTEYEIDDGVPQYDVEFHQGDWEYEFEIHAENGDILSFDKDHKHD